MLVNYEKVRFQLGDNKTKVELTDDFHILEHIFAERKQRNIVNGNQLLDFGNLRDQSKHLCNLISFLSSSSALWFSPGLIFALNRLYFGSWSLFSVF